VNLEPNSEPKYIFELVGQYDEVFLYKTDPTEIDTDNDDMDDFWEVNFGTDPLVNDANEDPDLDTLTNLEEYNYGTDPLEADTDGDGFGDGVEIDEGTDPLDPEDYPDDPTTPITPTNEGLLIGGLVSFALVVFMATTMILLSERRKKYLN